MAQLNNGSVEILSRDDGTILSQATSGSSKTVLLNQPSVVKIHGTREMVAEYERQGNDLILHMKDGTTVRYQQFFFDDVDGEHSELVFDDGVNRPEHVLFPVTNELDAQTAMVLTPQYESLGSIEPLLLADTGAGNGVMTAAGIGALGLVGVGIGALAGGGGGGGGDDNNGGTNPPATTPTLTIGNFAGDNILDGSEKQTSQLLSGTTTNVQAGQTVTITLNGVNYTAVVQANGSWSVSVPASALQALASGTATFSATVTNASGQTATDTHNFTVEPTVVPGVPTLTIGTFAGDNVLDGAEKQTSQLLSGTTTNVQAGQTVTITLNGVSYTASVQANGSWSVSVPASALQALASGTATLSATVTNASGQTATDTHNFTVQPDATGSISITAPVSGDGYLNATEAQSALTISGTASGLPAGTAISVTLGGHAYTTTTAANGSWSISVPSADLQSLPQGSNLIVATATLANGTTLQNSTVVTVDVHTTLPNGGIDLPFGDGVLSGAEAGSSQTITGNTGVSGAGQTVTVTFNGNTYTGTVNSNGSWSVTLPANAVSTPIEGQLPLVVTVTDPAGNKTTTTTQVNVDTQPPGLEVNIPDAPLNAADVGQALTLTGISTGGQTVTVTLDGQTYTATVGANGSWSVNIPASALQQLEQGNNSLTVTASDKYGNTVSSDPLNLNVDTLPPAVSVNPVSGDGYVSAAELAGNLTISGRAEANSTIQVKFGDVTLTTTTNGSGDWSVVVPPESKATLVDGSYPVTVTATDAAGNQGTAYTEVTFAAQPANQPTITFNSFAGDNILQGAELNVAQELSGTAAHVQAGQTLTLTFNGVQYTTTVLAGGLWHVSIPASALSGLSDGQTVTYSATVADRAGNVATSSGSVSVALDPAAASLAIAPISEDNWVNAQEAQSPVSVNGTSLNLPVGAPLTVTFNGHTYNTTVAADGSWSITIPPADFAGVANGSYPVVVTDANNNSVTSSLNLGVQVNFPNNIEFNAAFGGDNILNLGESTTPQVLSGNTGLALPDQVVTVSLNGVNYPATVNPATGEWSVTLPPSALSGLPQGSNTVTVTVSDAAGNQIVSSTTVSVDTTPPTLSVGTIAGDGVINASEQNQPLALSGQAEALSTITVVINGVTYHSAADASGSWSVNVDPATLQGLSDGKYDISITARDSGGNETTVQAPIVIDTAPPVVTVAPVSGDGYLNAAEHNAALAIVGTTEPGAGVVVTINNVDYTATVAADGSWSANIPANVVSGLADGSYTVTVTATDSLGNMGSSSQPLTVIASAASLPVITVGAFAGDNIVDGAEKGLSQLMTGSTSNVQAGQVVTVTLNGNQYTGLVNADGSWSVLVPAAALANLANGTDSYTVSVSDVAGNPTSANGSFTVDNTFSAIAIGVISDDNMLSHNESLLPMAIHGFSRFVAAGSRVAVTFNGKEYLTTTNSDGSWTVNVPSADLVALPNGNLTVTATATDINGNTVTAQHSLDSSVTSELDLSINPPFGDALLNAAEAGSEQTLSGSTGVEGAGQTVSVVIAGITYTGTVDAQGNWSVSLPSAVLQSLPQGANSLSVTVADSAGNTSTATGNFTVDTVAPQVSVEALTGDNRINAAESGELQTLSGSGEVGDRITVTLNGETYTTTVGGTGSWSIDLPANALTALTNGSYPLQVTSTDTAGNSTTVTRTIEVDLTAPAVSVNPVSDGVINAAESGQPLVVTGSGEAGNVISVELNGTAFSAVVGTNGQWTLTIPGTYVAGVADGSYTLNVTATDPAGNTSSTSTPLAIDTGVPAIFVSNVTANNIVDGAEQQVAQIISGTVTNAEAGNTVIVTLNGESYTTMVQAGSPGSWQVELPASALSGLANGSYTLTVSITDQAGNTGSSSKTFTVDNTQPAIAFDPLSDDGYLNQQEAENGLAVSGSTLNIAEGSTVTFTFNGKTYSAQVQADGSWSTTIPAGDLTVLADGPFTATASVVAPNGTEVTSSSTLNVHINTLPQPTLEAPFGDSVLTNAEATAAAGQTLSGTTGETGNGQTVVVNIGGTDFNATVNSSGVWTLALTPEQLQALPTGQQNITVTATDVAGNSTTTTPVPVNIATELPPVTVGPVAEDGIINAAEHALPLDISGTTTAGNSVVVSLNGKTYEAVVDGDGNWSATIPANDVLALQNGGYPLTVTVSDPTGNQTVNSEVVQVQLTAPTYTLDPIAGDGIIDRAEAAQPLDITGTGTSGDTVSVTIGGQTLTTTVVNGAWSVTVPAETLGALPQGDNTVTVVVTAPNVNSASQNATVDVDTSITNQVLVNPVAGDDLINAAEATAGFNVTGSVPDGSTSVVVNFNGTNYPATVGPDGLWIATIPAGALNGVTDGSYTLTVTATTTAGDVATVTRPVGLDTTPPDFTVAPISTDGYLNAAEQGQPLTISGTGDSNDSVRVTLNGKVHTATVDGDGNWSVSVPPADLAALNNGDYTVSVAVKDGAGNISTQTPALTVDVAAPALTLNPPAGDNILNAAEQQEGITLSGSGERGASISVTLNNETYTTTVGPNGQWSLPLSADDLAALTNGNYPLSVTATDAAGNVTTQTTTLAVSVDAATLPTLTVNTFAGNNIVDGAEQHVNQVLSGTTTNVQEGQLVSVTLGGVTYTGVVQASGAWSMTIPASALEALSNGQQSYSVVVSDAAGNPATVSGSFEINNQFSGLAINPVSVDGYLNAEEAAQPLTISGTSANYTAGTQLTVAIGGASYLATVQADGSWSVTLPQNVVADFTDGTLPIVVSGPDAAGVTQTSSSSLVVIVDTLPVVAVNPPFGDGALNAQEATATQNITGSTGVTGDGQTVTLTLNGTTYTGIVAADGSWSVAVPATALAGLAQGDNSFSVVVSDAAGNSANTTQPFTVDTVAPTVTVASVAGDGILNAAEQGADLAVSGRGEAGDTIVVTLNGVTYQGVQVNGNGDWTVSVPSADLQALADGSYTLSVMATDAAGNSTTTSSPLEVKAAAADLPTISINTFAGNDILDGAEQQSSQLLSGTTSNVEAGQTVSITLGTEVYSALVQADGSWSVSIPASTLQGLENGTTTIAAAVSDAAGNPVSASHDVTVNSLASGISIDPISNDGYLNASEAQEPLIVTGHTANVDAGSQLTLTINGQTFQATVGNGGAWSVVVPAAALAGLPDGPATVGVSVTDATGNLVNSSASLNVVVNTLPAVTVDVPFNDGALNASEAALTQTLNGTTGVSGNGQTVSVTIDGTQYSGTVDGNGNWSISLPSAVLQSFEQGSNTLQVTATDAAGNASTQPVSFNVDTVAPAITLNPIAGDGIINASEAGQPLTISGSTDNGSGPALEGQTVTVNFNGQTWTTTVGADGSWTLDIPAAALTGVTDGNYTLTATVTDQAGNPGSNSADVTLATAALQPTINTPFGDGYLNQDEAGAGQTLSGTTGTVGAGQQVSVNIGGTDYPATVDNNGNWTLNIPAATLQGLNEGNLPITVTVTDAAGNSGTVSSAAIVDLTPPDLVLNNVAGDNVINPTEIQQTITVSGSTSPDEVGQQVSIIFNGIQPAYIAIVQSDGSWSFDLPGSVTKTLANGDYTVTATLTDSAGNQTVQTETVTVRATAADLPLITIAPVSGDDYINSTEHNQPLLLSGTTSDGVPDGQTVTITLGGQTYTTTVTGGEWRFSVPAADVQQLADGAQQVSVSVTDRDGNIANDSQDFTVVAQPGNLPTITIDPVTSDDMVDYQESRSDLTITGSSQHIPAGQTITVTLNNKNYTATVDADGNWQATVPAADVQALPQDGNTVTATGNDVAQNVATDSQEFTVHTVPPLLTVDVGVGADNILSLAEALACLLIEGTTLPNLNLTITVGAKVYNVLADADGNWSTTIPAADLLALVDGNVTVGVSVTDTNGNTTTSNVGIVVDVHDTPTLTLDLPFGDGLVSGVEAALAQTLTGTVSNLEVGTALVVTVGNLTFAGTVGADGTWSANIPAGALVGLGNGAVQVTVSTEAGLVNPASATASAELVLTTTLNPTINLPFVDGLLNVAEAGVAQTLTGTTGLIGAGQTISVTIGGTALTATVNDNGVWSATVSPAQLLALGNGNHEIVVTAGDAAGNSDSATLNFDAIVTALPTVSVGGLPLFGDGVLNAAEAALGGTLSGAITHAGGLAGLTVTVNVNGALLPATISADGTSWSLPLSAEVLQALPDGNWPISVTITDAVGNSSSANTSLVVAVHDIPAVTLVTPFVDGLLSIAEAGVAQLLSGSTGVTGAGQSVLVSINGGTAIAATVNANGDWSLNLTPDQLAGFGNGTKTVVVTATDSYGNESVLNGSYTAVLTAPVPTITNPFANDALGITQANGAITITGNTGVTGANQGVVLKVDVNGISYTGTVNSDGSWSVALPAGALSGLANGEHNLSVTVTDAAGNSASQTLGFDAYLTLPLPTVGVAFGDGYLNLNELTNGGTLTGTTGAVGAGQTVSVTLNGQTHAATVGTNGNWTLALTNAELSGIGQGSQNLSVTVTDPAGNSNTISEGFIVDTVAPAISGLTFAGDNTLSYLESLTTQTLTGTINAADVGSTVTLTIGSQTLTGTVQANGSWSVNVSVAALAELATNLGAYSVSITDAAGNTATANGSVILDLTVPLTPSITLNPVTGDNIINTADGATTTLSGALQNATPGVGGTITITVNGTLVSTVTVNAIRADNNWTSAALSTAEFPQGTDTVVVTYTPTVGSPVTTTTTVLVDTVVPTLTIGDFAGADNVLNASEAAVSQAISGTASLTEVGRTVTVTLGGKTYTTVVQAGGTWSLNVPSADLQALGQNAQTINASISDAAGNVGTATHGIVVATTPPLIALNVLAQDNIINGVEATLQQLLTGTATGADGQTVGVYLGNTLLASAVVTDGVFSIPLAAAEIALLASGTNVLSVRVNDVNGNQGSAALTVSKVLNTLALAVDPLFDNGFLSKADLLVDHVITGTGTIGATVSLSLGGQNLTATVGQDGKWSLAIPSSALSGVTDGNLALNVVVSDAAGNSKTLAENVTAIINNVPVVPALTGLFGGDNLLNHAEALLGQTIGGTLNAVAGSTVTVTLGTKTYTTTVQVGGAWSVNIGATDLLSLATGNATLGVKVVDPAGNTASNSVTVGLLTAEPSITLNTIFGDGALNLNDVTNFASQLISGTVKNVAAGTIVNLNVGNIVSATATVNADGTFSTNLTQAQLQLLTGNPNLTVTASLQDAAGNTASASGGLAVNLTAPSLVLNQLQLFGDGVLNAADALLTQTISGTTTAGARVVVSVNSTQLVATADSDGKFSIALTPALLATLTDGNLNVGVSVTDAAGNTTSNSLSAIVGINNLPSVTLNPLFGDGVLSVAEALLGQTLSGHVNNVAAGTSVRINVGTTTLTATTDANGNFTAALAPSLLTTLLTGNLTVGVAVTDAYGNNASASVGVIIGVQSAPTIAVNTIFGDGVLSAGDLANAQLISGTSTNAVAGSTVTVVLGTHTYTTTVGSGGGWSLSVPKADLATLANGTQTAQVTLSDPYGNSATTSGTVSVIAQNAPTITIGTLFGDGGLNAVEALSAQTISGTATNAEGSTIAVKVGALTLNAIVAANGSWSVSVPSASLLALADGTQTITASLVNGAGNTANGSASVIVGTHVTPTVTLTNASVFTDHYLNLAEAGAAQTLSGTATNAVGGTVAVNIAGTVYNTTVGSNGNWSVSVPSSGLSAIADGSHTVAVTVTDRAGNSASTSTSFTAVTHSLPAVGVDAVTSLVNVLLTGLTISGGTLRLATGTTVSITLSQNGQSQTQTAVIDANGRYSAKFTGGLLTTLNLGALVTVAAVDAAGNPATTSTTLLLGSLLPVSSTVAAASLMAVAADDSLAVASTDTSSTSSKTSTTTEESSSTAHAVAAAHSTLVTDSDTSSTDAATTSTSATTSTAAAATTPVEADSDAYTIGGVTITLADGQVLHGDSVTGSSGNDTISVGSMDFSHIDGGAGTDTLVLNGEHLTLDLTSLGLKVEHIEIIDLGSAGNNSIKLDLNEALNITDKQTDDLLIKGTLGDQVTLANGDGGIWATTGQRTVGGQTYDVYHNSALSSENTLGDVLIQHNLQVHVI